MVTPKKTIKKDLNYYLNLPWTYTVETAYDKGEKYYILRVNELPGACTDAPTLEEAMELIKEVITAFVEMYMEDGEEIPEPIDEEAYQGNIAYRTTARRHFVIAREAKKLNRSLSQVIDEYIDQAISNKNKH
jgi:antitoxin HicB